MKASRSNRLGGIGGHLWHAAIAATILGVLPLIAPSASAQTGPYPSRPITLIVPYGPGSANDLLARMLAPDLSANLGQNVVVDNKPGAGGSIGTAAIARARNDGYTIGISGSATFGVNPNLYTNLPYDARKDFTPLVKLASTPNVLVVPGQSDIKSVPELLARMKKQQLRYNSLGNGTTQHLAGALLASQAGAVADHLPYRSTGDALTALLSAQVDFAFYALPAVVNHIKDGRLRALGVTTPTPSAALPDVPSLSTTGLKDFDKTSVWFGMAAPAGLPDAVTVALHGALEKTLANPAMQARLLSSGYVLAPAASQAEFSSFIADQLSFWGQLIKVSGTKVE
ncbi:MAG: tripartite tricarboxylate transporter substrate binding protein [Burkholderiales bacterium]|nr:tripartite tricarboxylate transporter substrate binding protein [Burkholderiales bacterium]